MTYSYETYKGPERRGSAFMHPDAVLGFDSTNLALRELETGRPTECRRRKDDKDLIKAIIGARRALGITMSGVPTLSEPEYRETESSLAPEEEELILPEPSLTPEEAELTLQKLEVRFQNNVDLHEDLEWSKVKRSLEAKPEALWSIKQMEEAGHKPDVYDFDETGFCIGTCSEEVPESSRGCMYDRAALQYLRRRTRRDVFEDHLPELKRKGNAEEMAKAMRINLMDAKGYHVLQQKRTLDKETASWLLTDYTFRLDEEALVGCFRTDQKDGRVTFLRFTVYESEQNLGWRGSLRVPFAA